MPKKTDYKEIVKNKKFTFDGKVSVFSKSNSIIRTSVELGRKLENKNLKITIEVIDDA